MENLIRQVKSLLVRNQEVNKITGDNFNVFRILQVESSEVRLHSAFLAELLNPKGSHGQKDVFLKLFVNQFCFKKIEFETQTAKVTVEKHIGTIDLETAEGGRLDIHIQDIKGNQIIIENKIYAVDQRDQLLRYYNYSNKADLFYLNLCGAPPEDISKGELKIDQDFRCISYQDDVMNWLQACRKEVTLLPVVREALTHYINLIKYLTNRTTNNQMEQELTQIMKNNLKEAFAISGNLNHTLQAVVDDFGRTVEEHFKLLGYNCSFKVKFSENYTGIWISKPDWNYIKIGFQFHSKNSNMIYGITIKGDESGKKPIQIPEELNFSLRSLAYSFKKNDDWWPWYSKMEEPYRDWNRAEAYEAIADGSMLKVLVDKVSIMNDTLNSLKIKL